MYILKRPDSLSLVGNMNRLVVSTTRELLFVLKDHSGTVIVENSYEANDQYQIEIDIKSIVLPLLGFALNNTSSPYQQTAIVQTFTAEVSEVIDSLPSNTQSISFKVLRAGVDEFSDSTENFLEQNFLTWQPNTKYVTYYSPEFLTYYSISGATIMCRATMEDGSTSLISLASIPAGQCWTVPVQYAVIAGKLSKLPVYYDVWAENSSGQRMTYVQRYVADTMKSIVEEWILFENSLGGIDTFRAYGDSENTAEHTHNIVEIDDKQKEYRVDTERKHTKNTGFLDIKERNWLLDFFPSLGKYIYTDQHIRQIIVTESNVSYNAKTLPSTYTFTYRYTSVDPYLNLPRSNTPQDVLELKVPSVGSFTIAPRLVEFPRQVLSRGALFPIQDPYSEGWGTTTIEAVCQYLMTLIESDYGGTGGSGHTHINLPMLETLSLIGNYLTTDGKKISAGYADVAGELADTSSLHKLFLSKTSDDTAAGIITFLKGLVSEGIISAKQGVEIGEFVKGLYTGTGAAIDEKGNAEVESLRVRSYLEVMELIINRLSAIEGDQILTEADTIETVDDLGDGLYRLKLKEKWEGYFTAQVVGNVVKGIINTLASGSGVYYTSWMLVKDVDTATNQIVVQTYPDEDTPAGRNFPPCELMKIARWGNVADEKRQSCLYFSSSDNRILRLSRVTKPIIDIGNYGFILGELPEWFYDPEQKLPINKNGDAIYVKTLVYQNAVKMNYQGKPEATIVDRGNWMENPEEPYHFEAINAQTGVYETSDVWYRGCKWRCIKDCPTGAPRYDSMEWFMIEGNPDFTISIEVENGGLLDYDWFAAHGTDLVVTGQIHNQDVTADILDTDVSWTRRSKDAEGNWRVSDDEAWNALLRKGKTLHLTVDDISYNSSGLPQMLEFTATALLRDGVTAEDTITVI